MAAPLRRARKLFVRAEDVLQQVIDSSDEDDLSPYEDEDYEPPDDNISSSSMWVNKKHHTAYCFFA